MAQAVSTTFRVEPAVKSAFYRFCEDVGMTPSTAVNMFMKRTILEQRLPFEVSAYGGRERPALATERAMKEDDLSPAYSTIEELKAALDAED